MRLKAGLPEGWKIGHKTGTGQDLGDEFSTGYNDVGLDHRPGRPRRRRGGKVMMAATAAPIPDRAEADGGGRRRYRGRAARPLEPPSDATGCAASSRMKQDFLAASPAGVKRPYVLLQARVVADGVAAARRRWSRRREARIKTKSS